MTLYISVPMQSISWDLPMKCRVMLPGWSFPIVPTCFLILANKDSIHGFVLLFFIYLPESPNFSQVWEIMSNCCLFSWVTSWPYFPSKVEGVSQPSELCCCYCFCFVFSSGQTNRSIKELWASLFCIFLRHKLRSLGFFSTPRYLII